MPGHRSSAATLRKLAAHHAFYEFGDGTRGLWDTFSTRNLGFAVQRKMASKFGGDPNKMRAAAVEHISGLLDIDPARLNQAERTAFEDFAPLLWLVHDLSSWSEEERSALADVIRAKAAKDEVAYLRQLQRHHRLKAALLRLGSDG